LPPKRWGGMCGCFCPWALRTLVTSLLRSKAPTYVETRKELILQGNRAWRKLIGQITGNGQRRPLNRLCYFSASHWRCMMMPPNTGSTVFLSFNPRSTEPCIPPEMSQRRHSRFYIHTYIGPTYFIWGSHSKHIRVHKKKRRAEPLIHSQVLNLLHVNTNIQLVMQI